MSGVNDANPTSGTSMPKMAAYARFPPAAFLLKWLFLIYLDEHSYPNIT